MNTPIHNKTGKNGMIKFFQPWCGHCTSMKPAWDEVSEKMSDSSVYIADVNCSEESELCEANNVQGYPTIHYYVNGIKYDYTGGRGVEDLTTFVNEELMPKCIINDTSSNNNNDKNMCNEKEKSYIQKWNDKTLEEKKKELIRLNKMSGKMMKNDLKIWLRQRISILDQMVEPEVHWMDKVRDMIDPVTKYLTMEHMKLVFDLWMEQFQSVKSYVSNWFLEDPKVTAYTKKWKNQDGAAISKEILRLESMASKDMKNELKQWVLDRIDILKKMSTEEL